MILVYSDVLFQWQSSVCSSMSAFFSAGFFHLQYFLMSTYGLFRRETEGFDGKDKKYMICIDPVEITSLNVTVGVAEYMERWHQYSHKQRWRALAPAVRWCHNVLKCSPLPVVRKPWHSVTFMSHHFQLLPSGQHYRTLYTKRTRPRAVSVLMPSPSSTAGQSPLLCHS